jgi:hypothetical protein
LCSVKKSVSGEAAALLPAKRGVDAVLATMKKKKISTLFKSKHDWDSFKEDQGLSDELAQNTKDGYE